ncbi:MAG TPA: SBBP repeat-containing protein [Bryobacteraceae bacterium]|nr:SBBP repeat-containing protein [Bryobacteraceae bacterium]
MYSLRVFLRVFIPVCAAGLATAQAASVEPAVAKARETLATLPLRFEANAGQWNPQVRFATRSAGYGVALTGREALVSLAGKDGKTPRRIGISLDGGALSPEMDGVDPLPARGNYLLGNRREAWRTGVPQYTRVRYREVYPGTDLVYYGNGRQLEYDFVLRPGADPARIRLRFRGADRLTLTPDGDLELQAGGNRLVQKRPVVYQQAADGTRQEIAARYRLQGRNMARVEVAHYDRSRALVIDPVLQYASLYGGVAGDAVAAVKIDREGMVWAAGYVTDGGLAATGNPYSSEFKAASDLFVAKINPRAAGADSLLYFTYIGGNAADVATDMALDAAGNVYLTGSTTSTNFPLGGFAYQSALLSSGGTEAFVLRLQPSIGGEYSLTYSTYFGGNGTDEGRGIDVDAAGNIYIVGTTTSTNLPLTGSARQSTLWGPQDAFVAKFNPNALADPETLVYSTLLGGNGYDDGRSIAVTPEGMAYIAGSTSSSEFSWAGSPYYENYQGRVDVFLAKIDASQSGDASVPYASYFGGSELDEARRIALDPDGKVVLAGVTLSRDLPVSDGAFKTSAPGGDGDGFVARFDLDAPKESALLYCSYLGGSGGDVAYDLAVDAYGSIWVTGYTLSKDFPVTPDALSTVYPGGVNVFATKIDPTKSGADALVYSTYLGQINIHVGYSIAVGPDGSVAIGGVTSNPGIRATANATRADYAGGTSDGFVVVLGQ